VDQPHGRIVHRPEDCAVEWISDPNAWIALLTLTSLEIVLGIDNIIFISILAAKLPPHQQASARFWGLAAAMLSRILLLLSISVIIRLQRDLFVVFEHGFSGRDLILAGGGLFLLAKATYEIHDKLEGKEGHASARQAQTFAAVIGQIMLLDVVFSLDSVITAIGMADQIIIMVLAVLIAIGFMMAFAAPVSRFVERHPTVKMLALSFLLLIGVSLIAEAFEHHIPKGYIYFAMGFSIFVETLNLRTRATTEPVHLHQRYTED
jgi:predicted tellurium resistance membrane protein TerC